MHILDRYILRLHLPPYFFGLAIITFVFVMDFIFRYLSLFIGKGVDFLVVLEFFILSLGHMFALIIPMSVMPATMMAFGQLASENEITAMKSSGISLYRMIIPVLIASIILGAALIYYNNAILPETNHKCLNLYIDIQKMKPTLEIRENIFSDAIKGYTILVREKDDKTGEIKDVQIFQKQKGGIPTTIVANSGKMSFIDEDNVLRFELRDGEIHEMPDPKDVSTYRKTLFSNFTINMRDIDRSLDRSERTHRTDREMNVGMMREKIAEKQEEASGYRMAMNKDAAQAMISKLSLAVPELKELLAPVKQESGITTPGGETSPSRTETVSVEKTKHDIESAARIIDGCQRLISKYQVEIHKKFSIPFSCLIFVLVGAPLAIRAGKKGMTTSIGFSILFFLVYYMFLISGEKFADRQYMPAWLAMWLPNFILLSAAVLLLWSTVRESQTINWDRFNPRKRWRLKKRAVIL
ncbi:MAG: LptF/LptG family permease [Candidatus Krumholzibacteriota bacterium]|nr:LptF/LptG family permease [Candidatus Krumholzibacteriota bacterium]